MAISRKFKWGCIAPLVVFIAFIVGGFLVDYFMPSASERALPSSAKYVQTYFRGFNDFARLIKADIDPEDYSTYAEAINLTKRFDPSLHADIETMLNITVGDAPAWWNPPRADETTYFEYTEGDDYLRYLKIADGRIYQLTLSW